MKLLILTLIAVLGLTTITSAKDPVSVKIRLGQSKTADGGKVTIKFLSVVEDSRCPMNARCVWAGNAKIKVTVTVGRQRAETVELNSLTEPQVVTVHGYRLSLQDLNPQKGQPADWPKTPVKATISVEKA